MYSEQDLHRASQLREEIHRKALERVRAVYPDTENVADPYPVEAYFQEVWDYPGKWYTVVALPQEAGSRKALIESIARDTIRQYREKGIEPEEAPLRRLLAAYPDVVCDYCIVTRADQSAEAGGSFPYCGAGSHHLALETSARKLFAGGETWSYDLTRAKCRKLSGKALFAPAASDVWLNYRKAFLSPPHGNSYNDDDFERVNAALFPGGAEGLEVYRWTADWSDYFDKGREWWGALCLTVYDTALDRFVVILASATD